MNRVELNKIIREELKKTLNEKTSNRRTLNEVDGEYQLGQRCSRELEQLAKKFKGWVKDTEMNYPEEANNGALYDGMIELLEELVMVIDRQNGWMSSPTIN